MDALELAADLSDLAVEARELTAVLAPVELATVLTLARLSVSPSPILTEAAYSKSGGRGQGDRSTGRRKGVTVWSKLAAAWWSSR